MKTRWLMGASALFMGALAVGASFLPQEILAGADLAAAPAAVLGFQVLGAVYLGFAVLNWTARGILLGGVYARPVALGNFLHYAVGTIVLVKALFAHPATPLLLTATALYTLFAAWFGMTLFTHPKK